MQKEYRKSQKKAERTRQVKTWQQGATEVNSFLASAERQPKIKVYFIKRKSPPGGGFFLWWSIGDSGQALFHFAMLEASFCAWLNSTEPRPLGNEFSRNTSHSKNPLKADCLNGGASGTRTPDPLLAKQVL